MADTTTPAKKPPAPPPGLAKDGRKDGPGRTLWKQIVTSGRYVLRPDELRTLEDACKTADLIAELEKEAEGRPRTVRGSTGQPVINPLLAEARQCRLALNQLLKQLKLPDDDGGTVSINQQRGAAESRWGKTG